MSSRSTLNVSYIVACYSALFQIIVIVCSSTLDSCICEYHVYQNNWLTTHGEMLKCMREMYDRSNPFSVAVLKDRAAVGHVLGTTCVCFTNSAKI